MNERIQIGRNRRQKRLENLLPVGRAPDDCPDGRQLLSSLGDAYGEGDDKARYRTLQRDLDALVKTGRIKVVNPGGRPLRYQRIGTDLDDDPLVMQYTLDQVQKLVIDAVPQRRLERLWQQLLTGAGGDKKITGPVLDETRLRIVSETLRLQPVELHEGVLHAVIDALVRRCALKVGYRDAQGKITRPQLGGVNK